MHPVLIAAGSVLVVAAAGSGVSALAGWTADPAPTVVVRSSPTPSLPPRVETPLPSSAAPATTQAASTPAKPPTLPATFRWRSGAPVLSPKVDAAGVTGLKDLSVVYYGGAWRAFVTTVDSTGYSLAYLTFSRWADASSAPLHTLASAPLGQGFRSTPQVFYFAPQRLWYLVYQTGAASYSTNPDITDPNGWSAPKSFYDGVPDLVKSNLTGGFWVSMWVICDNADCYLFSSDNRGHLFRSQTSKQSFPNGMSPPVIAAQSTGQGTTFSASHVYRVSGTGQYLLLAQAFGGDGHAYLRSWTSPHIAGPWTPLDDTPAKPFAGAANVASSGGPWTGDIVYGEVLREGYDQSLTVNPCQLRLLAVGLDRRFNDNRSLQIGLLTQTNSTCR